MAIINQVVSGGGSSVAEPYVNWTVSNGKLVSTSSHVMNFDGVTELDVGMMKAYKSNTNITSVDMSDIVTIATPYCCREMFQDCTGLTGVDLSSLKTIEEGYSCRNMFKGCTNLQTANLSSLESIKGATVGSTNGAESMFEGCVSLTGIDLSKLKDTNQSSCSRMFFGCESLTGVDLSSLETLDKNQVFYNAFCGCTGITNVDLSKLTTASGQSCLNFMFDGCSSLTSFNLSSLKTVTGRWAMDSMFHNCTSLTSCSFPSLDTISQQGGMQSVFSGCTSLGSVYFYALTPSSFGTYTNQLHNLLYGVTGCTVHFPMAIQSTIGSWTDVTSGFGGINTTILYDIVTALVGADTSTYTRKQKESTSTATAWIDGNNVLFYTSGTTEPQVGDTIYSDSACTTAVTTISAIA